MFIFDCKYSFEVRALLVGLHNLPSFVDRHLSLCLFQNMTEVTVSKVNIIVAGIQAEN